MSRLGACRRSYRRVVLPTRSLFSELIQFDPVLVELGLTLRDFVEYVVYSWARVEEFYEHGQVHMLRPITVPGLIHTYLHEDVLMPSGFMMLSVGEREVMISVSHEICDAAYHYLHPFINRLMINDRLGVLHDCLWLGDDLVLEIQL